MLTSRKVCYLFCDAGCSAGYSAAAHSLCLKYIWRWPESCFCVPQGGYRQWLNEGLPAKQGASDYATSPADVIGERVALLAGTTSSSLCAPFLPQSVFPLFRCNHEGRSASQECCELVTSTAQWCIAKHVHYLAWRLLVVLDRLLEPRLDFGQLVTVCER